MKEYEIRDIALAPQGHQKIEWVRAHMPLLRGLEEEFTRIRPFEGVKISLSVHLEAKTAYLCKVLKEATGKNCTALLQERRIEKAKRMLRETDLSVMEICAAVGYSNSSYFYRIFESATGMSPSAWRVNSGCDERR